MNWVALPHNILERLEREGLSRNDRLLYVEGMAYASQNLTDGVVTARLPRLSDHPEPEDAAARLVEATAWELLDDGNYLITDYFTANLTREEIERRKEDARVRQERSRRHKVGDHSKCVRGRYCPEGALDPVTRDTTRDVTRESRHTLPTSPYLPDLTGKVGKGEGKQGAEDGHGSPTGSPVAASPPHVFADPQRMGHCHHCQLPAANKCHHNGVPKLLRQVADDTAHIGPLIPEREWDTTSHWWRAKINAPRIEWEWETVARPLSQDDFDRCDYIGIHVDAHLTEAEWEPWITELNGGLVSRFPKLDWCVEGDDNKTHVSVCGGKSHALPDVWEWERIAKELLAFPEVAP